MIAESLVFVFMDGFGLGGEDSAVNPLAGDDFEAMAALAGGRVTSAGIGVREDEDWLVRSIDANLEVEGLPQSGTGQATLFTGVNCSARAGRHYGPFPHSTSKSVIAKQNVFKQVVDSGLVAAFANPYPDRFFTYVERTNRWTVTTLCCLHAGVNLKTGADLKKGNAVAADITGASWPEQLRDDEIVTPGEAGRRLAVISRQSNFTLFEFYATDKAGHSLDYGRARKTLCLFDAFIGGLVAELDSTQTLLITSDHGNVEDMSIKTHTRNPVPLIVKGPGANVFDSVEDLTGVTPAVLKALGA
ncbi:MAG: alkaline phosphatase family protein [Rhodothermia bacterium]